MTAIRLADLCGAADNLALGMPLLTLDEFLAQREAA